MKEPWQSPFRDKVMFSVWPVYSPPGMRPYVTCYIPLWISKFESDINDCNLWKRVMYSLGEGSIFNVFSMQYQKLHALFFNGVRFKISQNICTLKKIAVPLHHWKRKTASKGSWNLLIPLENTAVLSVPSPGGGMVDARVSGARAERRAGSSPVLGTTKAT